MWKYTFVDTDPYELYHWGILGQKWGIRRYQNPDGTLTEAGKKRYWGGGSDYTHVGRKRYIKDLVKDYNQINGTNVNLRKAVVRVDGKYFTGKGVELDARNLQITRLTEPTSQTKQSNENKSHTIDADSVKSDIDRKRNGEMTSAELRAAKEYYELLNAYERAGAEYAARHQTKGQIFKRFAKDSGSNLAKEALSALGKGLSKKIVAQITGVKTMDISKLNDEQLKLVKDYIALLVKGEGTSEG